MVSNPDKKSPKTARSSGSLKHSYFDCQGNHQDFYGSLYPFGERSARGILDCLSFAPGTDGIKLCIQNNLAAILTFKADICRGIKIPIRNDADIMPSVLEQQVPE